MFYLEDSFINIFICNFTLQTIRLLVKAYRHAANPPHYCLTRVEKARSHNKQLTISLWAPTVGWHRPKRSPATPALPFRRRMFLEAFGTCRPRDATTSIIQIPGISHISSFLFARTSHVKVWYAKLLGFFLYMGKGNLLLFNSWYLFLCFWHFFGAQDFSLWEDQTK